MKQQSGFRGGWLLFPLLLIVLALVFMPGRKQNELSYQQFKQVLESGDVGSLNEDAGVAVFGVDRNKSKLIHLAVSSLYSSGQLSDRI